MSLLCKHWQFLPGISAMAKQNQTNKKNVKTQLSATTPPLGCAILFFCFLFFLCFLFLRFLGFLFSGSLLVFLKGSQNNTKVKDLDLTLCQFSHFRGCKLAFGCFTVCFGPVVPLENHVKTMAKCRYHWKKLGGLGTQIRQLSLYVLFQKMRLKKCKTIGSQWMCSTDFDIDIIGSNPSVNTCSNILKDFLEKEWCISLKWLLPSTNAFLLKW